MNVHLPGVAGDQLRFEGPVRMAMGLAEADGGTVHSQDCLPRQLELASGLLA